MKSKIELTGMLLGWFAIIAQLILMLANRQADIPETLIRFFSFFTILTNTLVALCFTAFVVLTRQNKTSILTKNGTVTALTAFILIVGLVYQFVLRSLWQPTGLQYLVDELLHTIIPLLVLVYWYVFIAKKPLKKKSTLVWLAYPILYVVYILIRGHFSGFYPYPFLNVSEIGLDQTLINISVILGISLLLMTVLLVINKIKVNRLNN